MADTQRPPPKKVFKAAESPKAVPIKKKSAKFIPATPVSGGNNSSNIVVKPVQQASQPIRKVTPSPAQQAARATPVKTVSNSSAPRPTTPRPVTPQSKSPVAQAKSKTQATPTQPRPKTPTKSVQSPSQGFVQQQARPKTPVQAQSRAPPAPAQAPRSPQVQKPSQAPKLPPAQQQQHRPTPPIQSAIKKTPPTALRSLRPVPASESGSESYSQTGSQRSSQRRVSFDMDSHQSKDFETASEGPEPATMHDVEEVETNDEETTERGSSEPNESENTEIEGTDRASSGESGQSEHDEALGDSSVLQSGPNTKEITNSIPPSTLQGTVEIPLKPVDASKDNVQGLDDPFVDQKPMSEGRASTSTQDFAEKASEALPDPGAATAKTFNGEKITQEVRYVDTEGKMPDLLIGLIGGTINEDAQIVDDAGNILGAVEGDIPSMLGKKVSPTGDVYDDDGEIAGHVSRNYSIEDPEEQILSEDEDGKVVDSDGNELGAVVRGKIKEMTDEEAKARKAAQDAAAAEEALQKSDIQLDIKSTKDMIHLVIRIPTTFQRQP